MTDHGAPPADGRPTLELVAARAGVSRATASRVLRGANNVSETARVAVLQAVDEMDYTVNRAARSLVTRRSDSIAFLVAENEERMFRDPYFLGVLRGAQSEAARAGLQMVFVIASTPSDTRQFQHFVGGGHVDGVLLVSLHGDDDLARHLESLGVPTVLNGRPFSNRSGLFSVDSDNVAGAIAATRIMLERGARRIATITGPLDMGAGRDRLDGYQRAMREAGLVPADGWVVEGDFSVDGGAEAMARLLHADSELDGVFAASDLMALGALRTLSEAGRRVPDDVAVVGFDDVREAQLHVPGLTTIRQPLDELGRTMTRVLLSRINGEHVDARTVLPTAVVLRQSA